MSHGREKLPYLQFYVSDWRTDIPLRRCSLAARGLWIEMLCLMHHCEPYGTLADDASKPMLDSELAMFTGIAEGDLSTLLKELEARKVFSRDAHGRIYSRRMQRDNHIREVRAAAGRVGGRRTSARAKRK